ncbi:transmembrane protein 53-B [Halyomorpha halys]|uniref:transmembrane protein 53-B n=1 Tax=Halyomorpha halys TaxID=286706 RepID=UPI0006D4DE9B|nr:uncharacterized protein LOC106688806 [Halyomorpha halys]
MALRKIANELFLSTCSKQRFGYKIKLQNLSQIYQISTRNVFRSTLMKGVEMVSNDDFKIKRREGKLPLIETKPNNKPLILLFTWMGCTPKQSDKFVDLYLEKGFDVLVVSFFSSEVILWFQGAEKKASILLDFLHQNEAYQPIIYHGFSVGNGLWSSMVWQMSQNMDKHRRIMNRIKGQIWDSPPQTSNVVRNICYGVFPTSKTMGQFLYRIVRGILDVTGTDVLTPLYDRNARIFHNPPFKIPSLLFCTKGDMYSELEGNLAAFENWKSNGIQAYIKYWENSKHVGHFHLHREEYVGAINSFLSAIDDENQELEEVIAPYVIPQIQRIQIQNIR